MDIALDEVNNEVTENALNYSTVLMPDKRHSNKDTGPCNSIVHPKRLCPSDSCVDYPDLRTHAPNFSPCPPIPKFGTSALLPANIDVSAYGHTSTASQLASLSAEASTRFRNPLNVKKTQQKCTSGGHEKSKPYLGRSEWSKAAVDELHRIMRDSTHNYTPLYPQKKVCVSVIGRYVKECMIDNLLFTSKICINM